MNSADLDGLILDIKVAFGVPVVIFIMYSILARVTRGSKVGPWLDCLFLSFVLLLFTASMSTLMYQDRVVLKALWQGNPVLYSLIYTLGSVLIATGLAVVAYWKLRPELWRRK